MDSPEEKIILSTINCIEKYGLEKTTIRQIGKEAGMNSASISYYFRSKEVLIERVMDIALGNAFDIDNFKESIGLPAKERLMVIMEGMLVGSLRYPNITKAFFTDLLLGKSRGSRVSQHCNKFLNTIKTELETAYPHKMEEEIGTALISVASATFLFSGLFPNFFTIEPQLDPFDERSRKAYVRSVVEAYFKE